MYAGFSHLKLFLRHQHWPEVIKFRICSKLNFIKCFKEKYIYRHLCIHILIYPQISVWVLCRNITLLRVTIYRQFHFLVYFYCIEKISKLISLCSILWHVWRWCFRGVMQRPRLDRAVLTEHCRFAYVINPVALLIEPCQNYSFQKLLQKDLNSFVPCHQNVCSFFYTSTPGSVSAQHLLQYFEFILFIFCFIFFSWCTFHVQSWSYHFQYILLLFSPAPKPYYS